MLTYDDPSHTYTWFGYRIPSLSEVLKEGGFSRDYSLIDQTVLERKRLIGKAVHKAIELYLRGNLPDSFFSDDSTPEGSEPYFDSFLKALASLPEIPEGSVLEEPVGGWCGYGTTPDCVTPEAIIEWKCTWRIEPSVWAQLAGQAHALSDERGEDCKNRIVLRMRKDGKKAEMKEDKELTRHRELFDSILFQRQWKKDYGFSI